MTHTLAAAGMILKSTYQEPLRRTAVVALLLVAAVGCSVPVNVDKPSTQREPPATIIGVTAINNVSKNQAIEIACRAMRVKKTDSFLNVLPQHCQTETNRLGLCSTPILLVIIGM
jgi:hypothetical protein